MPFANGYKLGGGSRLGGGKTYRFSSSLGGGTSAPAATTASGSSSSSAQLSGLGAQTAQMQKSYEGLLTIMQSQLKNSQDATAKRQQLLDTLTQQQTQQREVALSERMSAQALKDEERERMALLFARTQKDAGARVGLLRTMLANRGAQPLAAPGVSVR